MDISATEMDSSVPEDILEEAKIATFNLLPPKSKEKYEKEFRIFDSWRKTRGVCGVSEDILLAYFLGIAKVCKASSLWTKYSMLKSTINIFEGIDVSRFAKLTAYLKSQSRLHQPKKAKTLERNHIERFLVEAPDDKYLLMKVALLMSISGACRCDELAKLSINDIKDNGSYLYIVIPDTKTNKPRSFTMIGEGFPVNPLDIYQKYISLRPAHVNHDRFFLNYKNKKCTCQPVGINTLSKIPRAIATYLNLPNAETYTGHCFRRSSATLLANAGGDLITLKRHGGWKSSNVAEGYIEDCMASKMNIAKKILGAEKSQIASNSKISEGEPQSPVNVQMNVSSVQNGLSEAVDCKQFGGIHFHGNVENVTFHIYQNAKQ